jgi:hypothetical protein
MIRIAHLHAIRQMADQRVAFVLVDSQSVRNDLVTSPGPARDISSDFTKF